MIKTSEFFTAWVSNLVKFREKGLSSMAAIWPSTERVNGGKREEASPYHFVII
jgi:hypothetical protein